MESEENTRVGTSKDELDAERESFSLEQVLATQATPESKEELTGERDAWRPMTVDADAEVPAAPAAAMPSPLLPGAAGFVSRRRWLEESDESLEKTTMNGWAIDESPAADVSQLPAFDPEPATSAHPADSFTPPPVFRRPAGSMRLRPSQSEHSPSRRSLDERRSNSLDLPRPSLQAMQHTDLREDWRTKRRSAPTSRVIHEGDAQEVSETNALSGWRGTCHSGSLLDWVATTSWRRHATWQCHWQWGCAGRAATQFVQGPFSPPEPERRGPSPAIASPPVRVTSLTTGVAGGMNVPAQEASGVGSSGCEASAEPGMQRRRSSLPTQRRGRGISFNLGHSLLDAMRRTKSTELPDASDVLPEGDGTSPTDAAASAEPSIPKSILRFASKWRSATKEMPSAPPAPDAEASQSGGSLRVNTSFRRKNLSRRVSTVIDPNLEVRTFR